MEQQPQFERTESGELTQGTLGKVTAGIDHMTKAELEQMKVAIQSMETGELSIEDLEGVIAGAPIDYEAAKEFHEGHSAGIK